MSAGSQRWSEAMKETYKGFTLKTADEWTTIERDGEEYGKVRGVDEARYWVDLYVRQNDE